MSMMDRYEELRQRIREEARMEAGIEARKKHLRLVYKARYGALPPALIEAIDATHDVELLERWLVLMVTRSPEELLATVQAERAGAA